VLSKTPAPPYHRGPMEVFTPSAPHVSSPVNRDTLPPLTIVTQPPVIPRQIYDGPVEVAGPSLGPTNGGPGVLGGDPNGPDIPGTGNRQLPPEIKPPKPAQPLKLSSGVMEAALIRQIQPIYPQSARMMHLSGEVVLHAIIGSDGSVRELQVMSGHPILAQAALAAVREWRYRPTMLSGEPVEVDTTITVHFDLGSQ
jgi:periplasmic protein TonB